MSQDHLVGLLEAPTEQERVIGRFRGGREGPTLVILGGIHGNEPSGVRAARRLLTALQRSKPPLAGAVVALVGNRQALALKTRFLLKDLNRQWSEDRVREILSGAGPSAEPEDRELRELHLALSRAIDEGRGEIYFFDLHTSSAEGPPFLTIGDTLRNRRFAQRFPLPVILGLEEQVDGALLEYLNNRGLVTVGVEAGRHDSPTSVQHHEAALWLALVHTGMLEASEVPDLELHVAVLQRASHGIPRIIEVRRRHAVRPGDGFRMEPGFLNFQPVTKGQLLARDGRGPIPAPESGLILLPLYQGQGDDGFFIGREVRPFWLRVSAWLRSMRLDRLVHLLPGVRRHPGHEGTLIVNVRVARLYPLEVFHLLGYRKRRRFGNVLLVSRRRYDLHPPARD